LWLKSISVFSLYSGKSKSRQKTLKTRNQEMSDKLRNGFQKKSVRIARVYYRFRGFRGFYLLT
jgi:hypothetical protein